jgi:hypothetical protein
MTVNRKRVERLWRLEGHRVPLRRVKASGQKALGISNRFRKRRRGEGNGLAVPIRIGD